MRWTHEVESTTSTTSTTTSTPLSGSFGGLTRWSPPLLPPRPPLPPLDRLVDSRGRVHRLHYLLHHFHHHLYTSGWFGGLTRWSPPLLPPRPPLSPLDRASTTSTTTSTASGSFGGLTKWSPPLLPPRPPLPPLDRASTTFTTTSMASGSFGGLTKWSPPLLPPRPPLPPLDRTSTTTSTTSTTTSMASGSHRLDSHTRQRSQKLFLAHSSSPGPTSPLSPTSISTNIASSSSYHDDHDSLDDSLQTRRKRMAKLTRTLGENIPPELVFNSQLHPSHSRSTSVEAASALANLTDTAKGSTEPSRHTQETLVPLRMKRLPQTPTTMSRSASLRAPSPSFVARRMMRKRHGQPHTTSHVELTPSAGRKSSDTIRSAVSSQGGAGNGIATADTASGSLGGLEVEPTASPTSRPYGGLARWSPPPSSTASRSRSRLTREGLRWTCQREELSETE
ncbi:hypothetical protein F5051DRAFT_446862 [Lentinula edodes]|nr:hypothetical protein F5051DRAFT_446862 [Lentinula edodes]